MYDASNRAHIKIKEREARLAERTNAEVITALMVSPQGRAWVHNRLSEAGLFQVTPPDDALIMAFNEGQRNQGLILFNDVLRHAPNHFVTMVQEANERHLTSDIRVRSVDDAGYSAEPDADESDAIDQYVSALTEPIEPKG